MKVCLPSRPSNPLSASSLAPQNRLWLTIVRVYKLYLLTYLLKLYHSHFSGARIQGEPPFFERETILRIFISDSGMKTRTFENQLHDITLLTLLKLVLDPPCMKVC